MRNILFKTDNSIEFSNMLTSVAVKTRCHTENLPTLDRHIFTKKKDDDDHRHHHHPLYRVHVRVPHGQTIQKKNYELKKKYGYQNRRYFTKSKER